VGRERKAGESAQQQAARLDQTQRSLAKGNDTFKRREKAKIASGELKEDYFDDTSDMDDAAIGEAYSKTTRLAKNKWSNSRLRNLHAVAYFNGKYKRFLFHS
jgi:hypothetical protein